MEPLPAYLSPVNIKQNRIPNGFSDMRFAKLKCNVAPFLQKYQTDLSVAHGALQSSHIFVGQIEIIVPVEYLDSLLDRRNVEFWRDLAIVPKSVTNIGLLCKVL